MASCLEASIIHCIPKRQRHNITHAKQPTKAQKTQYALIVSHLFNHKTKKPIHPIPGINEATTTAGTPYNR
jgi:hypothetical protein